MALLRDAGRLIRKPFSLSVSCVLGEAFAFPRELREPFPLPPPGLLGEALALPALFLKRQRPFELLPPGLVDPAFALLALSLDLRETLRFFGPLPFLRFGLQRAIPIGVACRPVAPREIP